MKPKRQKKADLKEKARRIEKLYAGFLEGIAVLRGRQAKIIQKYMRALEGRKLANVRKRLGLR